MNVRFHRFLVLSLLPLSVLTSCDKDDDDDDNNNDNPTVTIPSEYPSSDFESNAADKIAFTGELSSFTSAQKAADGGNTVTLASLQDAWNATALPNMTASDFIPLVETEIGKLATASAAGTYNWFTAPDNDGGHFENRVFSAQGLECVQLTEKGLFGAALYYQAQKLVADKGNDLTAADIDKLVALFGTTPAFPNSDKAANNPDAFQAKYAARRTRGDGGLYLDMRDWFIEARTYAAEGADYNSQKMSAVNNMLDAWEKSLAATTINYLHTTIAKLSVTSPDDATIEDGMHAYGEGVGFFSGLLANPAGYRSFTDAQGNSILELMNAPFGQDPTSYKLVQEPANELGDIQAAIDELQSIYDFSDQEIEDFKKNWVNEEGR